MDMVYELLLPYQLPNQKRRQDMDMRVQRETEDMQVTNHLRDHIFHGSQASDLPCMPDHVAYR